MADPSPFQSVLVGVDGTPTGRDAIVLGERLRGRAGYLALAHVALGQPPTYRDFDATSLWQEKRTMLERERDAIGVDAAVTGMLAPSVPSGFHQLAEDGDADLLVVGSCARGLIGRVMAGDDARGTVSGAPCPVAVAPHGYAARPAGIKTIGVAYNGSPESDAALEMAREFSAAGGARLLALTVVSPVPTAVGHWEHPDAARAREQAVLELVRSLEGVDEGRVALGRPAGELVAFADELDLLVVGSRGHGPLQRLILGSTSLQLTRAARCPLLIIPRPAVAEPVPVAVD